MAWLWEVKGGKWKVGSGKWKGEEWTEKAVSSELPGKAGLEGRKPWTMGKRDLGDALNGMEAQFRPGTSG